MLLVLLQMTRLLNVTSFSLALSIGSFVVIASVVWCSYNHCKGKKLDTTAPRVYKPLLLPKHRKKRISIQEVRDYLKSVGFPVNEPDRTLEFGRLTQGSECPAADSR